MISYAPQAQVHTIAAEIQAIDDRIIALQVGILVLKQEKWLPICDSALRLRKSPATIATAPALPVVSMPILAIPEEKLGVVTTVTRAVMAIQSPARVSDNQ